MRTRIASFALLTTVILGTAVRSDATHVAYPLVKQGHHSDHYVPVCIHESPASNGYIGNLIQSGDDITVADVKRAILEAIQIWNRYGLADVEIYYSGSCGSLSWPAADATGDGVDTPCADVNDSDTISEIGSSIDADRTNTGFYCGNTTDTDGDGTRNGDTINEFSIWLNPAKNWTRNLTATGLGTLIDRTIVHELGHAFGLRHITAPGGNGCNDASIMCTSADSNIFLLFSDTKVLVQDSVHDSGEDTEGWNDKHFLIAWRQADGSTTWQERSNAWGEFSDRSLLPPAIVANLTTSDYMVGWSRPADQGCLRTAIGNGTASSWTSTTYHGFACSFRSFAIARSAGKWLVAWREPGSATDSNRDIGTRYYDGTSWSNPVYLNLKVDAWSAPAAAYHAASNRFIVGWVHSGVADGLSGNRFARFRTTDANSNLTSWTPAVEIWADDDSDGVIDAGESLVPWDSFGIDCAGTGSECEVVYVEANNGRRLRSFRITVTSTGSVSYVPGSRQNVDASWAPYQAGTCYAINSSSDERRATGLRALTGYNTCSYPIFKQLKKIGALGTWGSAEAFTGPPGRDSFGRCGLTYSSSNAEWMMVELEGQ